METRQFDMMADMVANPEKSIYLLASLGLTSENTALLDKSVYENNEWILSLPAFQTDGLFDKAKFNKAYEEAKIAYNVLANTSYEEAVLKSAVYDANNVFVAPELRRSGPNFLEFNMPNPDKVTQSIVELGKSGDRWASVSELAQSNKVLLNPKEAYKDPSKALWGEAPDGFANGFLRYFTDTLVLAQYDDKGTHVDPITGQTVEHEKGDYILDPDGNYYYEKLDGRSVYDKQVLNKMDTLTSEGSWLNQYDFFDSDDINQKSIGGTILKNAALVGSMFLGGVGPYITAISIATQLAGMGATLGKMFVGSENETLSNLEGWAKSVNRLNAKSEYALQNLWCWENFINLIGDVAGQLRELRFIFEKVPKAFKGINPNTEEGGKAAKSLFDKEAQEFADRQISLLHSSNVTGTDLLNRVEEIMATKSMRAASKLRSYMKDYNTLGGAISKGYMTAVTVMDTYGEAKTAGASDTDAMLLTLGYASAEYALLSTGLGEWILPELRADRYKNQAIARALTQLKKEGSTVTDNARNQIIDTSTKEGKKAYVKKLFNMGKDIWKAEHAKGHRSLSDLTAKSVVASGLGEGFEEVSEEVLADVSKACYDIVSWLRGSDVRMDTFGYDFTNNVWDTKNLLDRYGMSLFGGMVGGTLANVGTEYRQFKDYSKMTSKLAMNELIYMVRNKEAKSFLKSVDKMELGRANLSTKFTTTENGEVIYEPGTKNDNQDLAIKKAIHNLVSIIEELLNAHGANLSDQSFLERQTLGDLRFNALTKSATAGFYLNEFNTLSSQLAEDVLALNNYNKSIEDTNGDGTTTDPEHRHHPEPTAEQKAEQKRLQDKVKETSKALEDLTQGKRSYDFIATALFEMLPLLSGKFLGTNFAFWVQQAKGKKIQDLSDKEKENYTTEYTNWKASEGRERIQLMSKLFRDVVEKASPTILKSVEDYLALSEEMLGLNNASGNLFNINTNLGENEINEYQNQVLLADLDIGLLLLSNVLPLQDFEKILKLRNRKPTLQLTPELQKRWSRVWADSYEKAIYTGISENIDAVMQPIFDRGFINHESKLWITTLLGNISNTLDDRLQDLRAIRDLFFVGSPEYQAEDIKCNQIETTKKSITDYNAALKTLDNTPIEQNLDLFAIAVGLLPVTLSTLSEKLNKLLLLNKDNLNSLRVSDELTQELNNALELLELYRSAILSARTDSVGVHNLFGYNATLNEIGGNEHPKLAEIDSNIANLMLQDIDSNISKLEFAKRVLEINNQSKLEKQERVSVKKDILIYNKFKAIVSIPDPNNPLSSWDGYSDLQQLITNDMKTHELVIARNNYSLKEDEKKELLKERIALENAIHEFLQKNASNLEDDVKIKDLLDHFNFYTRSKEMLTEDLDSLDDPSVFWWMITRGALKADSFYYMYKEVMGDLYAPLATQELAIYLNVAFALNNPFFRNIIERVRNNIYQDWQNKSEADRKQILLNLGYDDASADYNKTASRATLCFGFLPIVKYHNITLTEGGPGTGKSTAILGTTRAILDNFYKDLHNDAWCVHGVNPKVNQRNKADILSETLGFEQGKSKNLSKDLLMDLLVPNYNNHWDPTLNKAIIPENAMTLNSYGERVSNAGIKANITPPTIVYLDELSQFSTLDLDALEEAANLHGFVVFAAGDFDQSTFVADYQYDVQGLGRVTEHLQTARDMFVHPPKQGVPMRTDNKLLTDAISLILAYKQHPDPSTPIQFNYYLSDSEGLFGVKTHNHSGFRDGVAQDVLADIDKLILTLKPGQKIGYIYDDITSDLYQALSSQKYSQYIELMPGTYALGSEARYYVVDITMEDSNGNPIYSSLDQFLEALYTGVSRAEQGVLLVNDDTNDQITVISKKVDELVKENKNAELNAKYAKDYKARLDELITTTNVPQINKPLSGLLQNGQLNNGLLNGQSNGGSQVTPKWAVGDVITYQGAPYTITAIDLTNGVYEVTDASGTAAKIRIDLLNNGTKTTPAAQSGGNSGGNPYQSTINLMISNNLISNGYTILDGKVIITALCGNHNVPFYKDKDGTWVPFYGFAVDNSLIQGDLSSIQDVANTKQILDQYLGWAEDDQIDTDTGLHKYLPNNILTIGQIQDLVSGALPVTIDQIDLYKLDFVAKFNPVLQKTVYDDDDYEDKDDLAKDGLKESNLSNLNQGNVLKNILVKTSQQTIRVRQIVHTFNTFEIGGEEDLNGNFISPRKDVRIDSINGLMRIERTYGMPTDRPVNAYLPNLAWFKNMIMHTKTRAEMALKIIDRYSTVYGVTLDPSTYVLFAFKSSPIVTKDLYDGFAGLQARPTDKNNKERTRYNGSVDPNADELNSKLVVAVIGDSTNGNLLEIPLFTFTSPWTLIQLLNDLGGFIYGDLYNRFNQLLTANTSFHDISTILLNEFLNDPRYTDILNHLRMFDCTSAAVVYFGGQFAEWTPFKDMEYLGPQFVIHRGDYQINGEFQFDRSQLNAEQNTWKTVAEFALQHNGRLSKAIMVSTNRSYNDKVNPDGTVEYGLNAGEPFVLWTQDPDLVDDEAMAIQYQKQLDDPTVKKTVKAFYILPPTASIEEYFENVLNIVLKKPGVQPIGNALTSYHLLKVLLGNDTFRNLVSSTNVNGNDLLLALDSVVKQVERLPLDQRFAKMYEPTDWSPYGYGSSVKPLHLCHILDCIVAKSVYDINNTRALVEGTDGGAVYTLNNDRLDVIKQALADEGINGIYYRTKLPNSTVSIPVGSFIATNMWRQGATVVDAGYTIGGKDYHIHGKIDSVEMRGDLTDLVQYIVGDPNVMGKGLNKIPNSPESIQNGGSAMIYTGSDNNAYNNYSLKNPTLQYNLAKHAIIRDIQRGDPSITAAMLDPFFDSKGLNAQNGSFVNSSAKVLEATDKIANWINSSRKTGNVALKVNGRIIVTGANAALVGKAFTLLDNNGNQIVDVSNTFDGVNSYKFRIEADGQMMEAEYNGQTGKIEVTPPVQQGLQSLQITDFTQVISEQEFNIWFTPDVNTGETLISHFLNADFEGKNLTNDPIYSLLSTITTYQDFINFLNNLEPEGEIPDNVLAIMRTAGMLVEYQDLSGTNHYSRDAILTYLIEKSQDSEIKQIAEKMKQIEDMKKQPSSCSLTNIS